MLIILFKGLNKKCFSDLIITISSLVSILDDEAITIRDEGGQQQRTKTHFGNRGVGEGGTFLSLMVI